MTRLLGAGLVAVLLAGCGSDASSEYEVRVGKCVKYQQSQGRDVESALAICE